MIVCRGRGHVDNCGGGRRPRGNHEDDPDDKENDSDHNHQSADTGIRIIDANSREAQGTVTRGDNAPNQQKDSNHEQSDARVSMRIGSWSRLGIVDRGPHQSRDRFLPLEPTALALLQVERAAALSGGGNRGLYLIKFLTNAKKWGIPYRQCMAGTKPDVELADHVEVRMRGTLAALVRKVGLLGWAEQNELTIVALWNTVKRAMADERAGFSISLRAQNSGDLLVQEIGYLRESDRPFGIGALLVDSRGDIERRATEFAAEVEASTRSAKPRSRYHEGSWWSNLLFYGLPVAFVYLEWRGLPVFAGEAVLGASGVLAVLGFLRRFYSKGWLYERLDGASFRVPGP